MARYIYKELNIFKKQTKDYEPKKLTTLNNNPDSPFGLNNGGINFFKIKIAIVRQHYFVYRK